MGDPAGIGGEIIVKAIPSLTGRTIPVIIGDRKVLDKASESLGCKKRLTLKDFGGASAGEAECIDLNMIRNVRYGVVTPEHGIASYAYLIEALKFIFAGDISGLVTCPINKASIHMAGVTFPGHTELLAHYAGVTNYVMMMANRSMRVSLVTIHIPLAKVPLSISTEKVLRVIGLTHDFLKNFFGIAHPVIKVCGLNPHAGEGGIIGDEEKVIISAIKAARSTGIEVEGPYPADTLFHKRDCDAFVAMYHDQGLIPVKTLDFRRTVNITLGLPFVRTSPGHGTGFDIAGKSVADPTGLIEAYRVVEKMLLTQKPYTKNP